MGHDDDLFERFDSAKEEDSQNTKLCKILSISLPIIASLIVQKIQEVVNIAMLGH